MVYTRNFILPCKLFTNLTYSLGCYIGVKKSVDNRKLVMFNVPVNKTREEILEEMKVKTDCVSNIIAYPALGTDLKNCGFAIVEYECHRYVQINIYLLRMAPLKTLK